MKILLSHLVIIHFPPAKVNVAVSRITTVGNMVMLVPYLLRVLLGPLHPALVAVVYYYPGRAILTLTISLLTAKTLLMAAFILRFEIMTGEALNMLWL